MPFKICLLLLGFSNITVAEPTVLEVLAVHNRPAADLIPLLTPLLDADERLVANGDSLLVKTTPAKLDNLKTLVQQLDKPIKDLLITVLHNSPKSAEQLNTETSARLNKPEISMQGMNVDTRDTRALQNQQSIRVADGQSALISTGSIRQMQNVSLYPALNNNAANSNASTTNASTSSAATPVVNSNASGTPTPASSSATNPSMYGSVNSQMLKVETGFIVTASLNDQQVSLDISPWSEQFQQSYNQKTQHLHSQIHAKLGQWVELAGQGTASNNSVSGIETYQISSNKNVTRVLLKVEKVE